jgi:hypothetical protein
VAVIGTITGSDYVRADSRQTLPKFSRAKLLETIVAFQRVT